MAMFRLYCVCVALMCAVLALVAPMARAGGVRVDPASQQFVDAAGRVRVFHGVNVVYKLAPFYPDLEVFNTRTSLTDEDMANLQRWGMNVVRLGVMWRPVEPSQGQFNTTYLRVMRDISDDLGKYNIWTLVDSHQDVMSNYFCGEGFPAWAVDTLMNNSQSHWYSRFPSPLPIDLGIVNGFPNLTKCQEHAFFEYYLTVAANTAWQSLYSMPEMHKAFAAYWQQVAAAFNGSETVLGYELLNEPWPGDLYKDPLWFLEAGKQDDSNLMPLYEATYSALRQSDPDTVVMYEPGVSWSYLNQPFDFKTGPGGAQDNDKQAVAFHLYCIDQYANGDPKNITQCQDALAKHYDTAEKSVKAVGGGSMITEFGAVGDGIPSAEAIDALGDLADTHTQSWAYWTFKGFNDITTQNANTESFYNANGTLQTRKVKALARTYAQAIAGLAGSVRMQFDAQTAVFNLRYTHNPAATAPTVIYASQEFYYPNGLKATISPDTAELKRVNEFTYELVFTTPPAAGTQVSVTISPS